MRPLEELDWSPWNSYDEVRLIVSSPVLREIDFRKNKGNDRVGRRARDTSAKFRKMRKEAHKVIRASDPRVILLIQPQHTHSTELEKRLNYRERDDQLVGTAWKYSRDHQDLDVRLLTHDTTPLYTADGLGLTADQIPDSWLLPPERTQTERELASLKAEHARLKKTEPSISIRCLGQANSEIKCYEVTHTRFEPLTDQQVNELMRRLEDHFPLETDYGSREPAERASKQTAVNALMGAKQVYSPATDEEIEEYRENAYPEWLLACEEALRNYHRTLQRQIPVLKFLFLAENRGTRPATDALITIEAQGGFWIQPPSRQEEEEDDDDDKENTESSVVRPPPVAPRGQWRRIVLGNPARATRDAMARTMQMMQGLTDERLGIFDRPIIARPMFKIPNLQPPTHDSNAFYYKPDRPSVPEPSFALKCDQWRHDDGEEAFSGEIHLPTDQDQVKGALRCRIHAANMSEPASKIVPVRIEIAHISAFDSAQSMLKALFDRPKFRIAPQSTPRST